MLHVIIYLYMQDTKRQEGLSRLRGALLALLERLREALEVALARTPLVKGTVYDIARRSAPPQRSPPPRPLPRHPLPTRSEQGWYRMRSLPRPQLAEPRTSSA